jgi:hypothetical protein
MSKNTLTRDRNEIPRFEIRLDQSRQEMVVQLWGNHDGDSLLEYLASVLKQEVLYRISNNNVISAAASVVERELYDLVWSRALSLEYDNIWVFKSPHRNLSRKKELDLFLGFPVRVDELRDPFSEVETFDGAEDFDDQDMA